jgi:GT2 family glycosyltransferase
VLGHVRWARELKRTAFMVWLDRGIQFDYDSVAGTEAGPGHFYTSNISVKRTMLERVGGFDEDAFPFLYEDIDLGIRLAGHGFRLLYNRDARAEHLHDPRLEDWQRRMAATARAERTWVKRHPEQTPYFFDRFSEVADWGPVRGRIGRRLLPWVPRWVPVVGETVWRNADVYFRQQLGEPFIRAWKES